MMRVAPYIAQRAALSRRQAEQAILQGRVSRHGVPVTSFYVPDMDGVALDGQILLDPPEPKAWIYHKPPGQLVTRHDPQGRPTVWSTLRHWMPEGPLVCVGRLDALSEGLLIATNHPPLAHLLETSRQPRVYRVWVNGLFTPKNTAILRKGIVVDDIQYRPIRVVIEEASPEGSQLKVTLTEGKKREIRIVMDALGTPVTRLLRLSFGPWSLHDKGEGVIVEIASPEIQDFMRTTPRPEESLQGTQRPAPSLSRPSVSSSSRSAGFSSRGSATLSSARGASASSRGSGFSSRGASSSSRGSSGSFVSLRSSSSFPSRASRPAAPAQRATPPHAKSAPWTGKRQDEAPNGRTGGAPHGRTEGASRMGRAGERTDRASHPRAPKPYGSQGDKSSYPRAPKPYGSQGDRPRAAKPYGVQGDRPRAPKPYGSQRDKPSDHNRVQSPGPKGAKVVRPLDNRARPHSPEAGSLSTARRQPALWRSNDANSAPNHGRSRTPGASRTMRPFNPTSPRHQGSRALWTPPKASPKSERPTLSLHKKD